MLRNTDPAPEFTLKCQDNADHSLKDYAGKPLVILFFRGRFCPSSKKSLNSWQDFYSTMKQLDMGIIAISSDTIENHKWLHEQYALKFPLLSDSNLEVSRAYGIYEWVNKGIPYGEPALVIVDKDGEVAYSVISSGPKGMPDPGAIASMLIYMQTHGGKY